MTSAGLESAARKAARAPGHGSGGRGPGRRAGRRKIAVLEAACHVIAERGADAPASRTWRPKAASR
jgi:hypothetical protein